MSYTLEIKKVSSLYLLRYKRSGFLSFLRAWKLLSNNGVVMMFETLEEAQKSAELHIMKMHFVYDEEVEILK